jgi:ABC-type multidrug transport system fused ATPase/permease subunit
MNGRTLPRLAGRFRPEWPRLVLVMLLIAVSTGFLIAGPAIIGNAINLVFDGVVSKHLPASDTKGQIIAGLRAHGENQLAQMFAAMNITPGTGVMFSRLGQVLGLAAAVYLLAALATWGQAYLMAGVAQRTLYRLRQEAEEKLARLPLGYFDGHPHGEVLSRFTNDLDNLGSAFESGLSQIVTSVLSLGGVLGIMFWISPLFAGLTLVTVPLAILTTALIARRSRPHFTAQWFRTADLNGLVEETHTGHDLVMAFGRRQSLNDEFGRRNELLKNAGFRAGFLSGMIGPILVAVGNINYVFLAALGGFQVASGVISLGSVQALMAYSRQFSGPVTEVSSQINLLQSGFASAKRVFDFLDEPEDQEPAFTRTCTQTVSARRVELHHVCFRYTPDQPLIEDFSLEATPGQMIAIVGPTGAGKTTVVNLLMRFYEIHGGRILLDGADYRDLGRDEVRRCFGMVLQDTWLFAGTIWDNIAYGRQGASDQEIVAAARAASVDQFVRALPDGYSTVIDGEASGISVGQKQLLTIARAFLANPGILILDEATSNVDTRTEALVQNAMARLRSGRTSFVIAHRLSTIRDADTIVVMDAGRIVEQGSHAELLSRRGFYHELYQSQFAGTLAPGAEPAPAAERGRAPRPSASLPRS